MSPNHCPSPTLRSASAGVQADLEINSHSDYSIQINVSMRHSMIPNPRRPLEWE